MCSTSTCLINIHSSNLSHARTCARLQLHTTLPTHVHNQYHQLFPPLFSLRTFSSTSLAHTIQPPACPCITRQCRFEAHRSLAQSFFIILKIVTPTLVLCLVHARCRLPNLRFALRSAARLRISSQSTQIYFDSMNIILIGVTSRNMQVRI
jgi:hypothetical protein